MLEEFINKQIQEYLHSKNLETNLWDSKEIIRIYKTLYEEQELRRLKLIS